MKSPTYLFAFLPFLLLSCSTYKKVSLANFEEYKLTSEGKRDLHYVLKTQKLHYSNIDRKENNNFYANGESVPYYSSSAIYEENIVIPNGAKGVCVHSRNDHFIIDFGEGVLVPFRIMNDDNRASGKIEVNGRTYSLVESNRKASLFFNTRSH